MPAGEELPTKTETAPPPVDLGTNPLWELLKIAAPTVATMTSYTVMQFADKLMVSRIGPDPVYVGAQGNGGLAAFVPISIVMGLLTVVNTYVSQNVGAGKAERAPAYAWTALWLAVVGGVLLVPYGFALPWIFEMLGHSGRQLELQVQYGQVLVFGAGLTIATRGLSQFFYGMHKPGVVLIAGVAGNLTNLFLNWVLIFGNLGMPALGIQGAAIATVIGTGVELLIPLGMFLSAKYHRLYRTRDSWRPDLARMKEVLKLGWPGGVMFGNEMVCWAFFMVYLVGEFGPKHSTAGWIAHQYMSLSFMPAVGISVALTAMVGKCIGAGRPDLAAQRAWLGIGLAVVYMGLCGVAFVVFREPMVRLFIEEGTSAEDVAVLLALGGKFMIATAAFQLFDAVAMTVSGALRGAGDTVWPGVVTVGCAWTVIVGGGLAMVRYFPELESLGPWIAAATYIVVLAVVLMVRFLGGKWRGMKVV
jgi:multidrug resistance protein, MATE family